MAATSIVGVLLQTQGILEMINKIGKLVSSTLQYEYHFLTDVKKLDIHGRLLVVESIISSFNNQKEYHSQHPINIILNNMKNNLIKIHTELDSINGKIKRHEQKFFNYWRTIDLSLHLTNIETLMVMLEKYQDTLLKVMAIHVFSVNDENEESKCKQNEGRDDGRDKRGENGREKGVDSNRGRKDMKRSNAIDINEIRKGFSNVKAKKKSIYSEECDSSSSSSNSDISWIYDIDHINNTLINAITAVENVGKNSPSNPGLHISDDFRKRHDIQNKHIETFDSDEKTKQFEKEKDKNNEKEKVGERNIMNEHIDVNIYNITQCNQFPSMISSISAISNIPTLRLESETPLLQYQEKSILEIPTLMLNSTIEGIGCNNTSINTSDINTGTKSNSLIISLDSTLRVEDYEKETGEILEPKKENDKKEKEENDEDKKEEECTVLKEDEIKKKTEIKIEDKGEDKEDEKEKKKLPNIMERLAAKKK